MVSWVASWQSLQAAYSRAGATSQLKRLGIEVDQKRQRQQRQVMRYSGQ